MVKRERKPKKPLDLSIVKGLGAGLRDILIAGATHPATAGLTVMALTSTVRLVSGAYHEKTETQRRLAGELTSLYNGAQAIAAGAILAPIVGSGLQMVTSFAAKRATGGAPVPP